jgi:hypothetical protein
VVVVQLVFTLVSSAVLVGWFARSAHDPREVAAWARAHGLQLTGRNRPMVTYYVRLAIVLRVIGGVSGLTLGGLFDDAVGLDTSSGVGFWIWIVLGWVLGATWAEYRLTRPRGTAGSASLTPRDMRDYLSPTFHAAPLAGAIAVAIAAGIGLLLDDPVDPWRGELPPDAALVAAAVGSLLAAGLTTAAMHAVVARRQPPGESSVLAADDAIRASAVHHLAGGGTAAVLLLLAQLALSLTQPYYLPFGLRFWLPAIPAFGALFAWRFFAYRGWRVHRAAPTAVTA